MLAYTVRMNTDAGVNVDRFYTNSLGMARRVARRWVAAYPMHTVVVMNSKTRRKVTF